MPNEPEQAAMKNTAALAWTDSVRGQIIGGDHVAGRWYYDGRTQGPVLSASTEAELMDAADGAMAQRRTDLGEAFHMIYPASLWEFRVYQ